MNPAQTKTDRQILALQLKARKYPSAKKKIREVKQKKSHHEWLAQ